MNSSSLVLLLYIYIGLCTCLYADSERNGRVIGGQTTTIETRNFQVAIYWKSPMGYKLICGGSIYDELNVITAAQCLFDGDYDLTELDAAEIKILPGHVEVEDKDYGEEFYSIIGYCIHSSYDPERAAGDIAVIRLKKRLSLGDKVKSLSIAEAATEFNDADISGYGSEEARFINEKMKEQAKRSLRVAKVVIMTHAECLEKAKKKEKNDLLSSVIDSDDFRSYIDPIEPPTCSACSDSTTIDACDLDIGGPLVCYSDAKPILCGVISNGYGCGKGYPRFHTEVYHYAPWIKTIAGALDKCDAFFIQDPPPQKQYYEEDKSMKGCTETNGRCWKHCEGTTKKCFTNPLGETGNSLCGTEYDCSTTHPCEGACE